jgi:glycosyltransferase involved in cell wall biosynthesis
MVVLDNRERKSDVPFFTIITVVRNGAPTIERCIKSIASQTFRDFEYLVVEGASSDETLEIAKANTSTIDLLISEEDNGLYFAMNKAIGLARGRYIGILNADDAYFPETLDAVWSLLKENPECDVIYGAMEYFSLPGEAFFIHCDELPRHMIFHPTCFVSRNAYGRNGLFNTKYRVAADYDLMFRLSKGKERFLGTELVLAKFSEGGISSKLRLRSMLETSEIQAKYNLESRFRKSIKLVRIITATYVKMILRKPIDWLVGIVRRYGQ